MDIGGTSIPTWAVASAGLLLLVQLTLQIVAIVDIARRPAGRVRGNKWLWVLVVIVLELLGPILYFGFGRLPAPAEDTGRAAVASDDAVERATDVLYGGQTPPEDQPRP
jgi:hypothetical protein